MTKRRGRAVTIGAIGFTVLTMWALAAPGASAHATLVSTTPAANSTVTTPPRNVVLEFDEPIADQGAAIVVTDSSGAAYQQADSLSYDGATLSVALSPLTEAGAYTVAARWVADDGDPQTSSFQFTFAPAGAAPTATPSGTGSNTTTAGSASTSPARWLVLGGIALLAGVGLWWARPRRTAGAPPDATTTPASPPTPGEPDRSAESD